MSSLTSTEKIDVDLLQTSSRTTSNPSTALGTSLESGYVYTALSQLEELGAVPPTHTPTTMADEALLKAHRTLLPILLLPRALNDYDKSLRAAFVPLLSALHASVKHLPKALPHASAAQLRTRLLKYTQRLSDSQVEDASAALAQGAATIYEQINETWGALVPSTTSSCSSTLASDLLSHASQIRSNVEKVQRLDRHIVNAHRIAISMYHAAARIAQTAVEIDTSARQRHPSHDHTRANELVARGAMIRAKLNMLHAQIQREIYTPESVKALRVVAAEVSQREQEVEREIEVEGGRLSEYRSLGSDFENIVREVLKTREKLEQKEWSRKELLSLR
ncbi:hypothetical protein BWQ96_05626 [Gracilariopsis chorda]|uniref:Uncharacterized protein n=1 Tax=Gracilariopsis chorda TaxID=448386 RepID=A0A2V3IR79_9FLOR|nr:hypothetical protein BWQ96_05626 [Gracilariopsis chorda]|eukprot:PXF44631.1 hypothetical protein BWQ96_05626 [Gracilariopsis chorda]